MALPITPPSCFIIQPKRHRVLPPDVPFSLRPLFISSISQMAVVLKICVFFLDVVTESLDVALLNRSRRIRINERTYTHTRTHGDGCTRTHTYNVSISIELPMGHVQHLYLNFNVSDSTHSPKEKREDREGERDGNRKAGRQHSTPTKARETQRCYLRLKSSTGSLRHLL